MENEEELCQSRQQIKIYSVIIKKSCNFTFQQTKLNCVVCENVIKPTPFKGKKESRGWMDAEICPNLTSWQKAKVEANEENKTETKAKAEISTGTT